LLRPRIVTSRPNLAALSVTNRRGTSCIMHVVSSLHHITIQ
jgi:hypothetical protein